MIVLGSREREKKIKRVGRRRDEGREDWIGYQVQAFFSNAKDYQRWPPLNRKRI